MDHPDRYKKVYPDPLFHILYQDMLEEDPQMPSPQEIHAENPRDNRITAWGAIAWSLGLVFGVFASSALLLSQAIRPLPPSATIVFFLTALLTILWMGMVWPLRPHRSWPVGRQILWASVFAVATGVLLSSSLPWYFHWVLRFSH